MNCFNCHRLWAQWCVHCIFYKTFAKTINHSFKNLAHSYWLATRHQLSDKQEGASCTQGFASFKGAPSLQFNCIQTEIAAAVQIYICHVIYVFIIKRGIAGFCYYGCVFHHVSVPVQTTISADRWRG